jgi:dTDP-4-dehydrorhamnose 3,5-epimerase
VKFLATDIVGAYVIEPEPVLDDRGYFSRTFCVVEFEKQGLVTRIAQTSVSFNARAGTLRGMHFAEPAEVKLVRCTRGGIYDVILDLREKSPSYLSWVSTELDEKNGLSLYIPAGVAHGFYTLEDDSEVFYQISEVYDATAARGVRWDDPAFGIEWPGRPAVISDRDRGYPLTS